MILVTGGAGYIGSHFIKHYLDTNPGQQVIVVDNLSEGHADAVSYSPDITLYTHNIGDTEAMARVFAAHPITAVVHFAASCYVGESQEKPALYFENNVIQSLRLFEAMEAAGVRQIVFSSTCATYGNPQYLPLDESHPQQPINVYGTTKLMIEKALDGYAQSRGWGYVALRYFNAAGADASGLLGERHDPETHLIPLVLQTAMGMRPHIGIFGDDYDTADGTCIRDYIHVTDLARAHSRALTYLETHSGGTAINLGTTHGASVKEVIEACEAVTGVSIPVVTSPRRPGDPPSLVANAQKAKTLLDWSTQYSLQETIASAWNANAHYKTAVQQAH